MAGEESQLRLYFRVYHKQTFLGRSDGGRL
jgi:hypothetical protein